MKPKFINILAAAAVVVVALASCTRDDSPAPGRGSEPDSEVEISFRSDAKTRATGTNPGTPNEKMVVDLDLLVFDSDGFKLWRSAYKVDDRFRATLPVGQGLDVYFIANYRPVITALHGSGELADGRSWEDIRLKLIDNNPMRLVVDNDFVPLPMWGQLLNQKVEDVPINKWSTVTLLRSVASVDVYVNPDVENFTMKNLRLYFTPDKGFLAPRTGNYDASAHAVYDAESPAGMTTTFTLITNSYDAENKCIANKLYLYDNNTSSKNRTSLPDTSHRHSRLVVGGDYRGNTYYYPIDFAAPAPADSLEMIKRNWKFVFTINKVTSPGYNNPDVASQEPMVGLDLSIEEWNENDESDFWVSGPYHLGVNKHAATLSRPAGSTDVIIARSNIKVDNIELTFENEQNGPTIAIGTEKIANNRFRVEMVKDAGGYISRLLFTALGDYDPAVTTRNEDTLILTSGRIRAEITITQLDGSDTDWDDGGEIGDGGLGS